MDQRLMVLGAALWREDRSQVLAAIREVGAWPARGLLLGTVAEGREERLYEVVADFVGFVRKRGWPRDAGGMMLYCEGRSRADGAGALSAERKRRDSERRPWQSSAAAEALEGAGVAWAVELMRVQEERPLGSMSPGHWEMVRELETLTEEYTRRKALKDG